MAPVIVSFVLVCLIMFIVRDISLYPLTQAFPVSYLSWKINIQLHIELTLHPEKYHASETIDHYILLRHCNRHTFQTEHTLIRAYMKLRTKSPPQWPAPRHGQSPARPTASQPLTRHYPVRESLSSMGSAPALLEIANGWPWWGSLWVLQQYEANCKIWFRKLLLDFMVWGSNLTK
jgi:hypothetical protein